MLRSSRSAPLTLLAAATSVAVLTVSTAALATPSGASVSPNRFQRLNLIADTHGKARITDPHLVNAWGLAATPTSPLWVSDNGADVSTVYTGATGTGNPPMRRMVVSIPGGAPTGVVFNPTSRFVLSRQGKSGPATFIFAGEHGNISAWNHSGNPTKAVLVAHTPNSVYKGLTRVTMHGRSFLLAANFHLDRVDVFNSRFVRVSRPSAFQGRGIPRGYAPFNVSTLGGRVYVTYAKQDAAKVDDMAGPGHGFVNVFSQSGRFLRSLVRRGALNSPWGLAIAPRAFGAFAGDLLIGNFGNGRIHVVNRKTGHVLATLLNGRGKPISIDGLWGLRPGNGTFGRRSDVVFSAGPGGEAHGLVGILRARS